VLPFIGEYQPLADIPITSVATAWDHPETGETYILVINEALYFGDRMNHSLICPNQLRDFGLIVNDVPSYYDQTSSHSIIIPSINLELPLQMRGVFSYLDTRKPTDSELLRCKQVELTSETPWYPGSASKEEVEGLHRKGNLLFPVCSDRHPLELMDDVLPRLISLIRIQAQPDSSIYEHHEADIFAHELDLREAMAANANADPREAAAVNAGPRTSIITKEDLARRWFIGLEAAEATLKATTQEGMRYVEGDMERRLRTSQHHLRFPTLNCTIYTDTMFSKHRSVRGFNCAQVFTDGKGFYRVYPMQRKGDAHHALSQFIHDVGIPRSCLSDLAPEEWHGD
jgi:hypothetical protein